MNSCLYKCKISHERFLPRPHRFDYNLFLYYLDLDELPEVIGKTKLMSHNRFNAYEFRDTDHLQEGGSSVKENLSRYLNEAGIHSAIGSVKLLTMLRTWGYAFNPVSFYFVEDEAGQPLCVVAEVANTFNELKLYLLDSSRLQKDVYRDKQLKHFYISPFSELDMQLGFNLPIPSDRLALTVNEFDNDGALTFSSVLSGDKRPLNDAALMKETVRFPFMTLQVVWSIHWQALRLLLKKVPHYKKRANPHLQTNTRTYL